nr:MAG TPA: hypothetical protein [Caudoviricetes sp.]
MSGKWEGALVLVYTLYANTKVHDIVWSLQKCKAAILEWRVESNELY